MAIKNVLIINAHQRYKGYSEGRLNKTMATVAKEFFESKKCTVMETYIEKGYVAADEVEKHLQADLIILQTPVYWFSAPYIYKKYVDEVFTAGMSKQTMLVGDGRTREDPQRQYGTGGKLKGKRFMISATWNAPEAAFNDKKQYLFAGKNTDEVFLSLTTAYKFCAATILPDFNCFDVMKNPHIEEDIIRYKKHLEAILIKN